MVLLVALGTAEFSQVMVASVDSDDTQVFRLVVAIFRDVVADRSPWSNPLRSGSK